MTVRVGKAQSDDRPVNAGAPQGSVLGCYLFNIGIDDLEDGFEPSSSTFDEDSRETLNRTDDFPASSTPLRVRLREPTPAMSPIIEERPSQDFEIGYRVANVPPYLKKKKDPAFIDRPIKSLKFVDDSVNIDKVNMRKLRLLMEGNRPVRELRAIRTQELLQHIASAATAKGMKINEKNRTDVRVCGDRI